MKRFAILVTVLALLVGTSVAYPSDGGDRMSWYQQSVSGRRPDSREGATFFTRSNGNVGLFGGFQERNAINLGPNIYFNDVYNLNISMNANCTEDEGCSNEFYTWERIHNGSGVAPAKRSLFCSGYDARTDSLYIYGGVNYTNTFSSFVFYNDTWRFDFSTNSWTQLFPTGNPGFKGGPGCDYANGAIYLFGGSFLSGGTASIPYDETWKYSIAQNTWTLIGSRDAGVTPATEPYPGKRLQQVFVRIPDTNSIFMTDGFNEINGIAFPYNDVWILDTTVNKWTQLANTGHPSIIREYLGAVFLSQRYLMTQGGDAQTQNAGQICTPGGLVCFVADSPTDDTFIYDLYEQKWTRVILDHTLQPLKRTMVLKTKQNVVLLFGGHNFDGQNGIGDMRDRLLWGLQPKPKYLSNFRPPVTSTPQQYCSARTFPAGTQGYFCSPTQNAYYQCLDGAFASQSSLVQCPAGTTCKCYEGVECSSQGSPCA